jgi:hypothetical protein
MELEIRFYLWFDSLRQDGRLAISFTVPSDRSWAHCWVRTLGTTGFYEASAKRISNKKRTHYFWQRVPDIPFG